MAIINIEFSKIRTLKKGSIYFCDVSAGSIHKAQYMLNYIKGIDSNSIIFGPIHTKIITAPLEDYIDYIQQKKENLILVRYENAPLSSLKKIIGESIIAEYLKQQKISS